MKSLKDIQNIIDRIDSFQSELDSIKKLFKEILQDDKTELLLDPEEYKRRKKRERNQRFYQKNKDKHWK
jgi:hypothetical protein